jgi:hypothetical protein
MKIRYYVPALILLVLGLCGMFTSPRAAEIVYVEGVVQVQPTNAGEWQKADKGTRVNVGDAIRTARHSRADIALDEAKQNIIRLDPKTMIVLTDATSGSVDRLDLSHGRVYSNLENIKAGFTYEVTTPSAVAGVRGSGYSVYSERDSDEVQAYKDDVSIRTFDTEKNTLSETTLPEGFKTFIERFETAGALTQVSEREYSRFDDAVGEMIGHAEGKGDDQIQKERQEAQQAAQQAQGQAEPVKSAVEQVGDQMTGQDQVNQDLEDAKEQIEETNIDKLIEERQEPPEYHEEYHYE